MTIKNNQFSVVKFCGKAILILVVYCCVMVLAGCAGWFGGELLHDLTH